MNDLAATITNGPPPAAVEPPAPAAVEPPAPAAPAAVDPPVAVEPPAPRNEAPKWALERISQESARAREERGLREVAERKAQEYEAMLERMRQQPPVDPARQPQPPQRQEPPRPDSRDAIEAAAARHVYLRDVEDVRSKGLSQYGAEFNDTIRAVTAYGVDDAFLQDVIDADRSNAAAMLQQLAHDADRTIAMTRMSSRQRIAELARMNMVEAQKSGASAGGAASAPRSATSRAPAPPPSVQPTARQETDWRSDKASEKDYTSGFRETFKKRHGHYPSV